MRVYIFSPIPFSFLHQRPQKIAEELRRQSLAVTFIEPYGFTEFFAGRKTIRIRDIVSSLFYHLSALVGFFSRGVQNPVPRSANAGDTPDSFEILSLPLVLPSNRLNSALLDSLNAAVFRLWLSRTVLGRKGCREGDVALVQQPYFGSVLRKNDFSRIYYDCLDDLSVFSGHGSRERLMGFEDALLRMSDSVFVTSESLELDIRRRHPDLEPIRIPNGVDYDRFQELAATSPVPEGLESVTGPVAGYVGILRSWFDTQLMELLAKRNPEITFVLVGPYDDTPEMRRLKSLPNVAFPGRKPYDQIPSYIQSFDVCLIPFRPGEIAETTNPVKVFEYFALGKPVVSTWLRELVPFHERGLLAMVKSHEEFAKSLHRLLVENDEKSDADRRSVARNNSWGVHVRQMLSVMQSQDSAG